MDSHGAARIVLRPPTDQLRRTALCLSEELGRLRAELLDAETEVEELRWAMRGIALELLPNHAWTLQGFDKCSPLPTRERRTARTGTA